jgi:hypothetical protein
VEAVEFPAADTHLNLRLTVENYKINRLLFSAGSYGLCFLQDLFLLLFLSVSEDPLDLSLLPFPQYLVDST